ncbi:hypothetical protein MKEN_00392500 [Mycena kentingensis (nom. inval.)]|nr:hypothetical protein MKEN_00392500 [Mycena kentingensis (nom. inval.)]
MRRSLLDETRGSVEMRPSPSDITLTTQSSLRPPMRFTLALTALAACVASTSAVTVAWYEGADCTGELYYSDPAVQVGQCYGYGGLPVSSHKSIYFEGVPHEIHAFVSGGPHDSCSNGYHAKGTGSGCLTAPAGFNWESFETTTA